MNEIEKEIEEIKAVAKGLDITYTGAEEILVCMRKLGYRNVKDKVVLSKEEYIENDRLMKLLEEKRLDELKSIHKIFDKARKEMAREIFSKIIWFAVKRIGQTSGDSYYQISFDRLNELAKECEVEVE